MSLQKKLKSLTIDDMTRGLVAHLSGISMGSSTKCQNIWCYYTSTMRGWLQYYYLYKWKDGIVIILRFPRIVMEHIETHQNKQNYLPVSSHLPPSINHKKKICTIQCTVKEISIYQETVEKNEMEKKLSNRKLNAFIFSNVFVYFLRPMISLRNSHNFLQLHTADTIRQFFGFSQSHYLP